MVRSLAKIGGLVIPVELRAKGAVRPSLIGRLLADVLDHFAAEQPERQEHKAWLLNLLAGVRHRQPFDSALRLQLATEIKDHFRGNEGDRTWLRNRIRQFCDDLQRAHDHGQRQRETA